MQNLNHIVIRSLCDNISPEKPGAFLRLELPMRKPIISVMSVILLASLGFGWPASAAETTGAAGADSAKLRNDAPERYVVVPGDTLWSISARFLKDPWLWPQIWGLNRDELKSPHKIYPGNVIALVKTADGDRLRVVGEADTVKLSPKVRAEHTGDKAIPGIPTADIGPFLSQPLVIEENGLASAPLVLGNSDNRVILSRGDVVYTSSLPTDKGSAWQLFRPGKALKDPDDDQVLGYEAVYLGDVKVEKFGDTGTISIVSSTEEILKGDRLVPAPATTFNNYAPRAPDKAIKGRIISVYGGVNTEAGRGSVITLNKGKRDGLEIGHVLAIYRKSVTALLSERREVVPLPDERTGLVFVFRVFDKVSYALIMHGTQPIQALDTVQTP